MAANPKLPLLEADHLIGIEYTLAHAEAVDTFLSELFTASNASSEDFALVAVGGYGRKELCPWSDIDVLLVHAAGLEDSLVEKVASAIWYPVWDRGLTLGHSVGTIEQVQDLVSQEFEWSTSVLDARHIVGNSKLASQVVDLAKEFWANDRTEKLAVLAEKVKERQQKYGDAAFQIEPDLKNGRGGLRDLHALQWAEKVLPGFSYDFLNEISEDVKVLLQARVELHRATNSANNKLTFDAQDDLAKKFKDATASELMSRLALAAKRIGWFSDEAWRRWETDVGKECRLIDLGTDAEVFEFTTGAIRLKPEVDLSEPPCHVLRMARVAAQHDIRMSRESLERMAEAGVGLPQPWNDESRSDFVELFLAGRPAIKVIEDLDHFGLMELILPEWEAVRCKPQRNVLHTYTVDRHLCEAAVRAGEFADRVDRPDLLVVGALLHDIGKGFPGDHTEVGVEVIARIGERMGFEENDISILADLCEHHLLLPDVATRRDLADPSTAALVAGAVENVSFLRLLHALTEADATSTGPSAWGPWKSGLVEELVERTTQILETGDYTQASSATEFPTVDLLERMSANETYIDGKNEFFTVVNGGNNKLFSLMAGVLAISGLKILRASSASIYVHEDIPDSPINSSIAQEPFSSYCCNFVVKRPAWGEIDWKAVESLALQALAGQLAIDARLAKRNQELAKVRKRIAAEPPRTEIKIDNTSSESATIIEVHSPAAIGLLYLLTSGLSNLRVEINHAQVQTFGPQMVNTFYVSNGLGEKISQTELIEETLLAISHVIELMA